MAQNHSLGLLLLVAADLVVECVSDSSTAKDRVKLPPLYFRAGVREYWLVDARKPDLEFVLYRRGRKGYEAAPPDAEGFRPSAVVGLGVRVVRLPLLSGLARYRLPTHPL